MRTVNIKQDMPTVAVATQRLHSLIREAHEEGQQRLLKIIHGYGSTGTGGAIRKELATVLQQLRKRGVLRAVVPGGQWGSSEDAALLAKQYPELRRDADLRQRNPGVTVIEVFVARHPGAKADDTPRYEGHRARKALRRKPTAADARLGHELTDDPERAYDRFLTPEYIARYGRP